MGGVTTAECLPFAPGHFCLYLSFFFAKNLEPDFPLRANVKTHWEQVWLFT